MLLHLLLVCICVDLKSLLGLKFLILDTCHPDALYINIYINVSKDVRICGYFLKPKGVRRKKLGNIALVYLTYAIYSMGLYI
jgi:hypothetical protein